MHKFLNEQVTMSFDLQPDGSHSTVTGKCAGVDEVGICILVDSDSMHHFYQWPRMLDLKF